MLEEAGLCGCFGTCCWRVRQRLMGAAEEVREEGSVP